IATPGTYTLSETGTNFLSGANSTRFQVQPLLVQSFAPTPTGFTVIFNEAFDPSTLNLYDAVSAGFGAADATLVGNTTAAVKGFLIVTATNPGLIFIKTGFLLAADAFHNTVANALLKNDTYTVTLRSATSGFKDANGVLLNSNGGNYTTTFTFTNAAVVLSV